MIKYLTTQGINHHLEELLKNAKSEIILISPYIKLHRRIKEILAEQKQNGVRIDIVCRKKDLKEDIAEYATNIVDVPTLHAKCYLNEREAILTSMNLYESSQQNNEEMGIYVCKKLCGRKLYSEIKKDIDRRFCKTGRHSESNKQPDAPPVKTGKKYTGKEGDDVLIIGKEYTVEELDDIFDFVYKPPAGIKEIHGSKNLVLFSNTQLCQDIWKGDILYYQGQNTGLEEQELIFGNEKLMDAYHDRNIKLYLFEDRVYRGLCIIVKKPYMEKGKWIFPLSLIAEKRKK